MDLIFAGLLIFYIGFVSGMLLARFYERADAIRANAAEYYLDSKNVRQFRYKTK